MTRRGARKPLVGIIPVSWIVVWFATGTLALGACTDPPPADRQSGCLDEQVQSLAISAAPRVLIDTALGEQTQTTISVVPLLPNEVSAPALDPAEDCEEYWLDLRGDGEFESSFGGRQTKLTILDFGEYPLQVTAIRADGQIVAGRVQLVKPAKKLPTIAVAIAPSDTFFVGVTTIVQIDALDPDGGTIMDVSVDWGDGANVFVAGYDFASGVQQLEHQYTEPGEFLFAVTVTDDDGQQANWSATLFASSQVFEVLEITTGRTATNARTYPVSSAVTAVAVAGGDAGLLMYTTTGDVLDMQGRLQVEPGKNIRVLHVEVDSTNRVAFLSADSSGLYFADVSDPARPALLEAGAFFPANVELTGRRNLRKSWSCNDGRDIWVSNELDGLYYFRLTQPTWIDAWRSGDPGGVPFPWDPQKRFDGSGNELAVVPEGNVEELACAGDRFLGLAKTGSFMIYDLKPFQETGAEPQAIYVDLPRATPGANRLAVAVDAITGPNEVTWHVAMGDQGAAQFHMRYGASVSQVTLATHFYAEFNFETRPDPVDFFFDVKRKGTDLFIADFAYGNQDAVLRMQPDNWDYSHGITRYWPYTDNKCLPENRKNKKLTPTDQLNDLTGCWSGFPAFEFIGGGQGELWTFGQTLGSEFVRLMRLDKGRVEPPLAVPATFSGVHLAGADRVWGLGVDSVSVFDTADFSGSADGIQPGPRATVSLPSAFFRLAVDAVERTPVMLANDAQIAWVDVDGQGYPTVATLITRSVAIESLAIDAARNRAAVISGDNRRIDMYRFSGSDLVKMSATVPGQYQQVQSCPDGLLAWRSINGLRQFEWIRDDGSAKIWGQLPIPVATAFTCDQDRLYVTDRSPGAEQVSVRAYSLAGSGPAMMEFSVPFPASFPPDTLDLDAADDILAVHLQGRGNGVYFYDISDRNKPVFIAADASAAAANLTGVQLLASSGQVFAGGLYDDQAIGSQIVVRRLD